MVTSSEEPAVSAAEGSSATDAMHAEAPSSAGWSGTVPAADTAMTASLRDPETGIPRKRCRNADSCRQLREMQTAAGWRVAAPIGRWMDASSCRPAAPGSQGVCRGRCPGGVRNARGPRNHHNGRRNHAGGVRGALPRRPVNRPGSPSDTRQRDEGRHEGIVERLATLRTYEDFVIGSRFHNQALFQVADKRFASYRCYAKMLEAEYTGGLLTAMSSTVAVWPRQAAHLHVP